MTVHLHASSFRSRARGLCRVLMYVSPDTVTAVTSRDTAALSLQCCLKESEGEYPYPVGPAPKYVPCFMSRGRGWEEWMWSRGLYFCPLFM